MSDARNTAVKPTVARPTGVPPSLLVTHDLMVGAGTSANSNSTVKVNYVGVLWRDGKKFDSSWGRGAPDVFSWQQTVDGFRQGVAGMKVGGRREVIAPPNLAYGTAGNGSIGPNETLVFVIDLLDAQ
ncbi:FKBP-type peptidyl-prolyl cis-trans isomerase [Frankia tisae]|uniref:FKBP-type peptidyl-prolyl cis-trans isomerase n=1 Tax=Frankia tisae TaxID=2950104 RepID=UPI0021C0B21F|nr:FKBP-type peptidyl-prolyl cis-trans isomerase [Frankia tisae]